MIAELWTTIKPNGQTPTEAELADMVYAVDTDSNGTISFAEFVRLLVGRARDYQNADAEIQEAFKVFDKDGDGFVTARELQLIFEKVGHRVDEYEALEILKEVDVEQRGKIGFEDFLKAVRK